MASRNRVQRLTDHNPQLSAGPFTALARAAVIAPAFTPGWVAERESSPGPFTGLPRRLGLSRLSSHRE